MGMNLSRLDDGEEFTCSNGMWAIIMASAYKTGWKPLGTIKLDDNDNPDLNWNKNDYSSHKGQIVTSDDAFQISKILKKFLEIEKENIDYNEQSTIKNFIGWLKTKDYINESYECYPGFEIH
jgi:hypothetical protein